MTNNCRNCKKSVDQDAKFCTRCGVSLSGKQPVKNNLQRKKEKVLGKQQAQQRSKIKIIMVVGAILLTAGWFYASLPKKTNPIIDAQPELLAEVKYPSSGQQMFDIPANIVNGKIIVPLELVKQRKFVSFLYNSAVNTIPLLAYISNKGKLVTAVSMCEPCSSKRFHITGEKLVCNSCGSTWELNNLEALSGACGKYPPDAIPSAVSGNEIQIDEAVVANWQPRI